MNAIGLSILVMLVVTVFFAPRRWALLAMAAGALYLTQHASIDVAGLNMFSMRFLEVASFIRVVARREFSFSKLNELDRLFLLLYSYSTIIFLLRSNEGQVYHIGLAVDAVFCYFTFRGLAGGMDDFRWFLRAFVILLIPYTALLFVEMRTAHNPFSILGGGEIVEYFRNGRVRCLGSFRLYILLGSLGASFLPLYIGLTFSRPNRFYAVIGIILCMAIVGFSNSSGPLVFACLVVLGWVLWPYRGRMRLIRRAGLAGLIGLALVMKAPIWYLPTHFSLGGAAWHRSYLISVAMRHFGDWWLWGMSSSKTSDWFATVLAIYGNADITNQFISFGLAAGLMTIALFVWLLVGAFRSLGKKLAEIRLAFGRPSEAEYLLWALGVMLAGHIANFFGITYFDQFYVIWFIQLAFISNLTHEYRYSSMPAVSAQSPVRIHSTAS
jgi:hypothetical protein